MLLWASTRLDGLITAEQRSSTIAGSARSSGPTAAGTSPRWDDWKRRDGTPNDPDGPSDGYATGLVVFVLRQAGVPATDPAMKRGVAWLLSHQRTSGRWFTRSVNNDKAHYITHAGTAFAILAPPVLRYQDRGIGTPSLKSARRKGSWPSLNPAYHTGRPRRRWARVSRPRREGDLRSAGWQGRETLPQSAKSAKLTFRCNAQRVFGNLRGLGGGEPSAHDVDHGQMDHCL